MHSRLPALLLASCSLAAMGPSAYAQSSAARADLPRPELQALAAAFGSLKADLAPPPDGAQLIVWAIKGMVQRADPAGGEYYTEAEWQAFKEGPKPGDASAGIEVHRRDGQVVLSPTPGSQAAEAGVRANDRLYAVDGKRVTGLGIPEVVALFKGNEGSAFTLTIFREETLEVLRLRIERRAFEQPAVSVTQPLPDVIVLRIPSFTQLSLKQAVDQLNASWRQKKPKALILDLRACPGGLVDTSIGIAALFLTPDTLIVTMKPNGDAAPQPYRASREQYAKGFPTDPLADLNPEARRVPLAVLIDDGTAAGAEIVAAALQDHGRARIFGRRTMGRGSIQTIRPFGSGQGAMKFTTAYWTSPSGHQIDGKGVDPDVLLDTAADGHAVVQMAAAALLSR